MLRRIFFVSLVFATISGSVARGQSRPPANKRPLPDFDIREQKLTASATSEQAQADVLVDKRKGNLLSFMQSSAQGSAGYRIVPNKYGLPKLYGREGQPLTTPSTLKPAEIAKGFLRNQPEVFFLGSSEIDNLRLAVEDVSDTAKFLAFTQTLNGIDVFNAQIKFTMNGRGEIIQVTTGDVVPGLNLSTSPRLKADDAVKAAFLAIGVAQPGSLSPAPQPPSQGTGHLAFLNPAGKNYSSITAELSIFPMNASSARLAYRIFIEVDSKSWYELLIDANDGTLLFRHNLYVYLAQGRVWTQSPSKGTRSLVTFPDGWFTGDGTVTTGNNVDAYLDANGNDLPDATTDPNLKDGRAYSATQTFDFEFGDGTVQLDPRLYRPSAVTNLFYFINTAHDYYYGLGFNEAAGNFQTNNFDKGGVGNDAVVAEAQFGLFPDNASFAPTPEGTQETVHAG